MQKYTMELTPQRTVFIEHVSLGRIHLHIPMFHDVGSRLRRRLLVVKSSSKYALHPGATNNISPQV